MMRAIVIVSALAACGGQGHQHVAFAKLLFEMPSDWSSQDSSRRGVATAVWTPDENEAKESITVVRTEMAQAVAHAGSPSLDAAVASAVGSLPSAHARTAERVVRVSPAQHAAAKNDSLPSPQRHVRADCVRGMQFESSGGPARISY